MRKKWFTISISSSKVSTTYFWKWIQVFVFWIPSDKKIFSVKYLPICLALKGFKKHVKSCFFVYSKYWMKNNSTIIKGNVNILNTFCWKKQMGGLFKTLQSKKYIMGWVGFWKSYVIVRVGHGKCLRPLTRWVGGLKKGQKHADVIFEWSLNLHGFFQFWT